jgi:hypothetical protein
VKDWRFSLQGTKSLVRFRTFALIRMATKANAHALIGGEVYVAITFYFANHCNVERKRMYSFDRTEPTSGFTGSREADIDRLSR